VTDQVWSSPWSLQTNYTHTHLGEQSSFLKLPFDGLGGAVPPPHLLVELEALLQEEATSSLGGMRKPARFRRSLIICPLTETSSAELE